MYEKYLLQLEEAGKIRNLKERSINCYKNYVSYFLNYMEKHPEELTCQDVRDFLLAKKDNGLKATTLNLYNSAIRFFYRNVLHVLWDDITVPRMIIEHKLPTVLSTDEIDRLLDATDDLKYKAMFATKVAHNIMNCKTGAYGANVCVCEDCGFVQIHYNSCRNRCCPMCQAVPKEMWMDARREDVLDAPYFHLVFTVPDILNPVIYSNQRLLYDALYHAASSTISELTADPKHLGAKVGYICILHTWGSEMNFHPHIHTILLGGGLASNNQWKDNGENFFLPIRVISKMFRGKYLEELKRLWEEDKLVFHGTAEKFRNHYTFKELLDSCYGMDWIPHCKKTFNGAQTVIKYLGKYTHRIAVSNHRIVRMDDDTVTFLVKDYRNEGQWKELTISGVEFVRRFLMHVPPRRFVRIRHYGLLCSRTKSQKLTLCRNLLGCKKYLSKLRDMEMPEILEHLYGIKVCVCKACGGHLGKPQMRMPLRC